MSLTYPDTRPEPQPIVPEMRSREAEAYTPVYARRPVRRKGKVKSWMILAPVGALTVAALGAWALMNPGEETAAPAARSRPRGCASRARWAGVRDGCRGR